MRNLRDMQNRLCKREALSIGALLGNLKGVLILDSLREKEHAYLGSFSWT
jgi:hypothetical protein